MRGERNPMEPQDVTFSTEIDVSVFKRSRYLGDDSKYRPTCAYVSAIKPCGCEGPHLGKVETVDMRDRRVFNYKNLPDHSTRPRLGGQMFKTLKEARKGKPRLQMKLWGVYPDKPHKWGTKPRPIGYVWGQDNAVQALKDYWVGE